MSRVCALLGLLAFGLAGCGSSNGGNGDELERFAGSWAVIEGQISGEGTQCPSPWTAMQENTLQVLVDRNSFEGRFGVRWGNVLGEIHEDGTALATGLGGVDESLRFSATFADGAEAQTVSGQMTYTQQACTRLFDIQGSRAAP